MGICQVAPLSVTRTTVTNRGIEVVLRNDSDKPIRGLCIRTPIGGPRQTKFLPPHQGILPGTSFTETIPVVGLPATEAEREIKMFTITCVVSSDGVRGTIREDVNSMAQALAGAAFQASRLSRLLTALSDSSNDQFGAATQELITRISSLDISLDDGSKAQGSFAAGMQNANTLLLSRLRRLQIMFAGGVNISELRTELSDIQREHRSLEEIASAGSRVKP